MLKLADQKLVAQLSDIRTRLDRDVWQNPHILYPHLVHHGVAEADILISFVKPLCELLPDKLTDSEVFVLSAAALLCNVGMQTPFSHPTIDDLEHIRRRHAELSYDYLMKAGSEGYIFVGLGLASVYLEPIALLCKGHEGLWLKEYQEIWSAAGRLRLDLLAALLQLGSKLATTRMLLNEAQLRQAPSQYRVSLWSLLYYEGVVFQQHTNTYQLKFALDPTAWELRQNIDAVIQNPIRQSFNQSLPFLNRYQLKIQLVRQEFREGRTGSLPDDVATHLKEQGTNLLPLMDNRSINLLPEGNLETCQTRLHSFLCETFLKGDLELLAWKLHIPYEDLRGDTISLKAKSLIEYTHNRGRFQELLEKVHDERPIPFINDPQLVLCLNNTSGFAGVIPQAPRISIGGSMQTVIDRPLQPGEVIPGYPQYEIIDLVSANVQGNSIVYHARDKEHDREVAIKEPTFFYKMSPQEEHEIMRKRFDREIKLLLQMRHPFIVPVYNVINRRYIIQEWIRGKTLRYYVKNGGLKVMQIVALAAEICDALRYAHRTYGFYHRDIKPDNIFQRDDGHACIIDFGLARAPGLVTDGNLTTHQPIGGTFAYMSPEQGISIDVDQRTDIFALGVTIYEILAQQLPYPYGAFNPVLYPGGSIPRPARLTKFRMDVPLDIEAFIMRAIELNREQRFPDWEAMCEALNAP